MHSVLTLLFSLNFLLPSCQSKEQRPQAVEAVKIDVQGLQRTYRTFTPPVERPERAMPLLFVFHGGSGDAKRAQKHFGFDELAREHHFLVVYPEAIDGHWNDGRNGEKFAAQDAKIDDVAYFRALLADVKSRHRVDSTRIYAMGASNGGMFVQRLALEVTGTFAAVASTISSLPEPLKAGFKPTHPLSVLFLSGTEDPLMPFEGGEVVFRLFGGRKKRPWEKGRGRVLAVRETARLWVAHNKIEEPAEVRLLPDLDTSDGSRVRLRRWKSKADEGPVVALYEVIGGGHTLPKLQSNAPKRVVGRTNGDVHTQQLIWRFFADKRRPPEKATDKADPLKVKPEPEQPNQE